MQNAILISLLVFTLYVVILILFYFRLKKYNTSPVANLATDDISIDKESFIFTDLDASHTNLVSTLEWKTPNTDDFVATKIYYRFTDDPDRAVLLTTSEWPKNSHQKHTHSHGGRATWYWVVAIFADGHTSEKIEVGAFKPELNIENN